MNTDESLMYAHATMSDEDRIAILADIILDAISAEEAQSTETEG